MYWIILLMYCYEWKNILIMDELLFLYWTFYIIMLLLVFFFSFFSFNTGYFHIFIYLFFERAVHSPSQIGVFCDGSNASQKIGHLVENEDF